MAKARSYSLILPLTTNNIRRSASKLECHEARLQTELDEIKRLKAALHAMCPHPRIVRGGDSYNGTWAECPDCGMNSFNPRTISVVRRFP